MTVYRSFMFAAMLAACAPATAATTQRLCGWLVNPTPANWWLTDSRGEWIIGMQGGHQADGALPDVNRDNRKLWVKTQGNGYGYGCVCIDAVVDAGQKQVVKISNARARSLSVCQRDKALKEPR